MGWWSLLSVALAQPPMPVVGGAPAPPGRWSDAVAIYGLGGQVTCTGVLVAPGLALTAGHCGVGVQGVLVGTHDLRSGGRVVGVLQSLVHQRPFDELDVTLLVLDDPVAEIQPRMLVRDCLAEGLADGAEVAVVGWGATDLEGVTYPRVLMEAQTSVRDADCSDLSAGCYPAVSPGGELVAGGDGVDSCAGDSGGPLYLLGAGEGEAWLAGITSRAAQPASTACGDGGIYVRADAIAAWAEEQGFDLPRPDCEGFNRRPAPSADVLVVARGGAAAVQLRVEDDPGDQHRVELPDGDGRLETWVDGLRVGVRAPLAGGGRERVRVRVTDDGSPPLSAELELEVRILDSPDLEGCATVGGAGPGAALVSLLALRRRRGSPAGA